MGLFQELKRRNVFRVAIAYLAGAWLLIEVAGTLFPVFGVPDWGVRFVVIVLALGFLPALIISWAYELTPEGLKREKDVVRDASIPPPHRQASGRDHNWVDVSGAGYRGRIGKPDGNACGYLR
jgi:adenylate cyclase